MTGSRRRAAATFLAGILLAAASPLGAGTSPSRNVSIEARLDRSQIAPGEEATLVVVVRSKGFKFIDVKAPEVHNLAIFRAGSAESFSVSNGVVERSSTLTYRLLAKTEGQFTVPPLRASVGKEVAETEPLMLTVTRPGGFGLTPGAAPQGGVRGGAPVGAPEIFVRASVDKPRVHWNEQVILRYSLYTRVELLDYPDWKPPAASGFWSESLGPPKIGRARIGGVEYSVVELATALFPTRTGALTVEPVRVRCRIARVAPPPDPWSSLAFPEVIPQERVLSSDPITIHVAALPPGAPEGFGGAVGEFDLKLRVDHRAGRAGEPVTVRAIIAGKGNISSVRDPQIRATAPVRQYVAGTATRIDRSAEGISGERNLDVALVSDAPGTLTLLPVRFAWFDPEANRYRIQNSDTVLVSIGPKSTPESAGSRPTPAKDALAAPRLGSGPRGALALEPPPAAAALAAASAVGYGLALAAGVFRRRRARDPRHARHRAISRLLAREIVRSRSLLVSGDPAGAAGIAAAALRAGAGHRYDADLAGLPLVEALPRLRERGAGDPEIAALEAPLHALEGIAFAPQESRPADTGRAIDVVEQRLTQYRRELE